LFGDKVLRRWPVELFNKLEREEDQEDGKKIKRKNWINYFHFLDPVSGALTTKFICRQDSPLDNYHLKRIFYLPGLAHMAYWKNKTVLGYLLSRFYGRDRVEFIREEAWSPVILAWLAILGYLIWLAVIALPVILILWIAGVFL
jgi:hypothetical protein